MLAGRIKGGRMADKVQLKLTSDILVPDIPPKFKSKYQKWRHEANYKKAI